MATKEKLNELEWKAEWYYEREKKRRLALGYHIPSFHISPYKVAPPKMDDGVRYCPACDPKLASSYGALSESDKEWHRGSVAAAKVCEIEFKAASK